MKCCKKCGENQELSSFHRNPTYKSGLDNVCKRCRKEEARLYGLLPEVKEHKKQYHKMYARTPKVKQRSLLYRRTSRGKEVCKKAVHRYRHSPEGLYHIYGRSAKKRNHAFDISFEDFMSFWQFPCSYCGDSIETIGLDRIDSSQGYILGNLIPCCYDCNEMKNNRSQNEFYDRIKKIVQHLPNEN